MPLAARAQKIEGVRRIGVLMNTSADTNAVANLADFTQALRQLGWTAGKNIRIEARWAEGRASEIRKHAAELVALAPDVIFSTGTAGMGALLQATRPCRSCS